MKYNISSFIFSCILFSIPFVSLNGDTQPITDQTSDTVRVEDKKDSIQKTVINKNADTDTQNKNTIKNKQDTNDKKGEIHPSSDLAIEKEIKTDSDKIINKSISDHKKQKIIQRQEISDTSNSQSKFNKKNTGNPDKKISDKQYSSLITSKDNSDSIHKDQQSDTSRDVNSGTENSKSTPDTAKNKTDNITASTGTGADTDIMNETGSHVEIKKDGKVNSHWDKQNNKSIGLSSAISERSENDTEINIKNKAKKTDKLQKPESDDVYTISSFNYPDHYELKVKICEEGRESDDYYTYEKGLGLSAHGVTLKNPVVYSICHIEYGTGKKLKPFTIDLNEKGKGKTDLPGCVIKDSDSPMGSIIIVLPENH